MNMGIAEGNFRVQHSAVVMTAAHSVNGQTQKAGSGNEALSFSVMVKHTNG